MTEIVYDHDEYDHIILWIECPAKREIKMQHVVEYIPGDILRRDLKQTQHFHTFCPLRTRLGVYLLSVDILSV